MLGQDLDRFPSAAGASRGIAEPPDHAADLGARLGLIVDDQHERAVRDRENIVVSWWHRALPARQACRWTLSTKRGGRFETLGASYRPRPHPVVTNGRGPGRTSAAAGVRCGHIPAGPRLALGPEELQVGEAQRRGAVAGIVVGL